MTTYYLHSAGNANSLYGDGKLNTKTIYGDTGLTINTNYKKYTYATDGVTLTDEISYFGTGTGADNKWHKKSDFVTKTDGVHAQRDEVYTGINATTGALTGLVEVDIMTFYDSGALRTKDIFNNAAGIKNNSYENYEYDSAGNRTAKIDGKHQTTNFLYDASRRGLKNHHPE